MEYYARVCILSAVLTSRCVGKFLHLDLPSVSRDIKFSNASRGKNRRQETHAVIIFYTCHSSLLFHKSAFPDFKSFHFSA